MRKKHKLASVFICFLLMCFLSFPVQAEEIDEEIQVESRLKISSKSEFLEFAENCRLDKYSENLVVVLETDIDLNGNKFDGIPIFCGMFDGNYHTISGINISGSGSAKGLFRYLTQDAVVQNLSVKGKVIPQGSKSILGGLAGNNAGTILNCSFSGEVDGKDYVGGLTGVNEVTGIIDSCQVEGMVLGIHFVGGITGENRGVIRNCSNLAKVNTEAQKSNLEVSDITIESLTNSEASYTITDIGGIAGSSSGVIKNCDNRGIVGYPHIGYNMGGIAGSQVGYVFQCENTGQVFGRKEVGGIVGQMEPVANLEFDKDTLQILESQLGATAATIEQSAGNIQAQMNQSTADISSQVEKLQSELNHTGDAVSQLLKETDTSSLDEMNKKIEELEKEQEKSGAKEETKNTAEEKEKTREQQNTEILNRLEELQKLAEEQNLDASSLAEISKRLEEFQNADDSSLNMEELSQQIEEYRKQQEASSVSETLALYEQLRQWEALKLPDSDSMQAAQNSLNQSMNSMSTTLNSITQSGQNTMNTMTNEMQRIMNQAKSITSTVANASDHLGISIMDASDTDTEDNLLAKIENCNNMGNIQADLNGGGIVGVIAIENDLDPEGELEISGNASLNLQGEMRAVILKCDNEAKVTVRNQNAGGIAGWMSLGLIKDCMNTGTIEAVNGDYVGGIVGISTGYIRNNSAKCEISGNSYVGGIAGSANIVSDCCSMVQLKSGNEKIGSILGDIQKNYRQQEEPVKNNFYLCIGQDFGGIDGISYSGLAEPLSRSRFFKLESLPEEFWKVKVTFIKEDNTYEQVLINHEGSLALDDIPEVPQKEGYFGYWEGLKEADTDKILFDISFKAFYTPIKGTIPSKIKGKNDKPILLLQGNFNATKEVALIETSSKPKNLEGAEILDAFGFTLESEEIVTAARYLIPEGAEGEELKVYIENQDIQWHETESHVEGSYLVFELENGENQIVIVENQKATSLWGAVALLVFVVFGFAIVLEKKQST